MFVCLDVPVSFWLSGSDMKDLCAYSELLLEFSLVLTNVWQLKIFCYLISLEASSSHVNLDSAFMVSY